MDQIELINKTEKTSIHIHWTFNREASKIPLPNNKHLFLGSLASANLKQDLLDKNVSDVICCIKPYAYNIINLYTDHVAWVYDFFFSLLPYDDFFKYYLVPIQDDGCKDIYPYFDSCADYINNVLENNGNALVHCYHGRSRSVSIVLAYLIKYHNMNVNDALKHVQIYRDIANPNEGYVEQLHNFYNEIQDNKNKNKDQDVNKIEK